MAERNLDPRIHEFARFTNDARVRPRLWHFNYPSLRNNWRTFQKFSQLLRDSANKQIRVLDVGCGFKPFSSVLESNRFTVYGVDYSADMSAADALAGADALPFPDNSFDAAIVSEVLEHVRHPYDVASEAARITRPGGLVFISTPFIFWEHGVPYDFQRPTRYFLRAAFDGHDVLALTPSSTILWSACTLVSLFVESTPLHRLPPLRYAAHFVINIIGATLDGLTRFFGGLLFRNWEDRFLTAPNGYAMIVRVKK